MKKGVGGEALQNGIPVNDLPKVGKARSQAGFYLTPIYKGGRHLSCVPSRQWQTNLVCPKCHRPGDLIVVSNENRKHIAKAVPLQPDDTLIAIICHRCDYRAYLITRERR